MNLNKGALLQGGKYRIEDVLGQGGFGITYLAVQSGLNRKVAIKEFFMKDLCNRDVDTSQVSVPSVGSKELVEKFKNKFITEACNIAKLHNPHIIRIIENFEENGTVYYVMDYIEGESLKDMLYPNKTLTEADALNYIRQVSDALAEVHANDMLHLDVKPGNIMVDSKGSVVLIDFGVSKRFDGGNGSEKLTTTTTLPYTPGYAPLEQMDQDASDLKPSADIYALGATLYRLLSGETPPTATALAGGRALPSLPSSVSPQVRRAIETAMQLNKLNRPQSIADFLALLDAPVSAVSEDTIKIPNVDESTVHEDDADKNDKTDNSVNAPKVADGKPVVDESEKKKSRSWMLWVLIALIGIGVGLFALFVGEAEGVDYETVPRTDAIAVDLGLSVKWADRNVGAYSPEGYGSYFAWGETQPKSFYDWSTYKWCESDEHQLTKYCTNSYYGYNGFTDGRTTLYSSDDAATANMGSSWRMPTYEELEELEDRCTWTRTTQKGVEGYKVTGPSGKSIFLPAAGYRGGSGLGGAGSYGYYWSSSLIENEPDHAWHLYLVSDYCSMDDYYRYYGRTVRAVAR